MSGASRARSSNRLSTALSGSKMRSALGEDFKEVYAEAKGSGFEPKIMRQIIKIRRMDKEEHDEQETLLDLYKRALSMVPESGPRAEAAE